MTFERLGKKPAREKTYSGLFPSWKYAEPIAYDCTLQRNAIAVLEADARVDKYSLIADIGQVLAGLQVRSVISIKASDGAMKLLCLAYADFLTPEIAAAARVLAPSPEERSVEIWTPAMLARDHHVATATSLVLGATKQIDHNLRADLTAAFRTASEVSLGSLIGLGGDKRARRAQVYALILDGILDLRDRGARFDDGARVTISAAAAEAADFAHDSWGAAA